LKVLVGLSAAEFGVIGHDEGRERMTRARVLVSGLLVLLLGGMALLLLWRGYSGPPVITVVNDSGSPLTNVTLEGNGFSQSLPDIVPGGSVTTIVHPRGESSFKVAF
jgi:hypothetical protein